MKRNPIWVLFVISFFFLLFSTTNYATDPLATTALFSFFSQLSNNNSVFDYPIIGWNLSSDPCMSNWTGIFCDKQNVSVQKIVLENYNLQGIFSPIILCSVPSLASSLSLINLNGNSLTGDNLEAIANCRQLTHFHISRNRFSGNLPDSFSHLNNLKRLGISENGFSGPLPNLPRISGLIDFFAQNNMLSGPIPDFDFSNFEFFNVSNNSLTGPIPPGGDSIPVTSYLGNPQLCGNPLPNKCQSQASVSNKKRPSNVEIFMYVGYVVIGLALFILIMIKLCKTKNKKKAKETVLGSKEVATGDDTSSVITKPSFVSNAFKSSIGNLSKSEIYTGVNSVESTTAPVSSSLIVLTSPEVNGLKFEELLKAPAELLGRGKHGSVYKVNWDDQKMTLAVKRIKDWAMTCADFKVRMRRLDQVKHPNVLPAIAFYCSRQEKLLVYEYQRNGSLFKLIHGIQIGQTFDWSSRLGVASTIAEALPFMHEELRIDGIAHGNLKSSNILFNKNMEPCISEYGLTPIDNQDFSIVASANNSFQANMDQREASFRGDVYALGVVLLELLTGKMTMVQNNGMDLATWAVYVVREEWTVEVFDRALIREGASEERMVNLLQVAIKCVNRSPEARSSINQVAVMINSIKEEDEISMDVSKTPPINFD